MNATTPQRIQDSTTRLARDSAAAIAVHGLDKHWQEPAATEKAAFEAISAHDSGHGFEYLGFAWATLIDGISSRSQNAHEVLSAMSDVNRRQPPTSRNRCTVVQHIRAGEFIDVFSALGVTDLFWSHATNTITQLNGIRIHPFPLFPAQAPKYVGCQSSSKRYLANFVGAYNPKIYLSDVRQVIFGDAGSSPDLMIIKREQWHFDRAVYDEQVRGRSPIEAELSKEDTNKREYLEAIQSSWFTLCPTGSGPNSIRIFESLALGSIPIILTKKLRLNGAPSLWQRAAIIEEDSEQGYRRALERARTMRTHAREAMTVAGSELFSIVGPLGYRDLIIEQMNEYE